MLTAVLMSTLPVACMQQQQQQMAMQGANGGAPMPQGLPEAVGGGASGMEAQSVVPAMAQA